jgi:hypothetical protein
MEVLAAVAHKLEALREQRLVVVEILHQYHLAKEAMVETVLIRVHQAVVEAVHPQPVEMQHRILVEMAVLEQQHQFQAQA